MKTQVIFLVHKDNQEVFAFFPNVKGDNQGKFRSYSQEGKYGVCSSDYVEECRIAETEEYDSLKQELESFYEEITVLNILTNRKRTKTMESMLQDLLGSVVEKNGGITAVKKYYQEQGLTDEKLYLDLWKQVPPLERQKLPLVTIKHIKAYFINLQWNQN